MKDVTTLEANEFCSIFRMNIFMPSSNNNNTNGKLNEREQKYIKKETRICTAVVTTNYIMYKKQGVEVGFNAQPF